MKKQILLGLLILLSCGAIAQTIKTQETSSHKFEFIAVPKLGYAKLIEAGNAPVTGFINAGDVLLSYQISKDYKLVTGIGMIDFDYNKTLSGSSAGFRNSYIRVPLNLTGTWSLHKVKPENETVFLAYGFGLYTNNLLKQEIDNGTVAVSAGNLGWNFGVSVQLGMKFIVSDVLNLGVGYEVQSDISKIKSNGVEQKMQGLNTINFTLGFKL
jgi:opacity protein-like surface antigen